jgi:hypothetical protein
LFGFPSIDPAVVIVGVNRMITAVIFWLLSSFPLALLVGRFMRAASQSDTPFNGAEQHSRTQQSQGPLGPVHGERN